MIELLAGPALACHDLEDAPGHVGFILQGCYEGILGRFFAGERLVNQRLNASAYFFGETIFPLAQLGQGFGRQNPSLDLSDRTLPQPYRHDPGEILGEPVLPILWAEDRPRQSHL